MSSNLDWQTEDEQQWGDFRPESEPRPGGRLPRRRLVAIVLALLLAIAGAALALNRFDRFLADSEGGVEQDVLSGHNVVIKAAEDGDSELVGGLIYDRLQEWTEAQVMLVERGLLLDRGPLELQLPAGSSPVFTEIELQPNLREALVSAGYEYHVGAGEPAGDSVVVLRQQFFYRLQDEQWLLNPPTAAFWGPWISTSGRYLTLHYPQRDEQIGRRLAADLEALIGQTCHETADLNCPADLHYQVVLSADPATLAELSEPDWRLGDGRQIELPTPTLIGLPENESGYRALRRGYGQRVAARLIAGHTNLATNQQRVIGSAIVDLALARQGLMTWPIGQASDAPSSDDLLSRASALWNTTQSLQALLPVEAMRPAHALVDFVAKEWSVLSPVAMIHSLEQANDLPDWLEILRPEAAEASLATAFGRYAAGRQSTVAPEVWPDEVVMMLCDQGMIGSASLYQYDPVPDVLSVVASGREFIRMEALLDGDGLVLTEALIRQDGQRTYLWQDGRLSPYESGGNGTGNAESRDAKRSATGRPARQNQSSAWSSDGRWLAELTNGSLILSAPGDEYRRLVESDARDCRAVAWVRSSA